MTLQLPALPEEHPLAAITKKIIIIIIIIITIIKSNNNNYNNKDKQAVHSFKPTKIIIIFDFFYFKYINVLSVV